MSNALFALTVTEVDKKIDTNIVTVQFDDGATFTKSFGRDPSIEALVAGGRYSLALVPFVTEATDSPPVPVEHPLVIAPDDAAVSAPAVASDAPPVAETPAVDAPAVVADETTPAPTDPSLPTEEYE